jgi:DNA-binding MarR family transcriptional regulator
MGEPRWLTDEQQRAWRRFAAVVMRLPGELDRQLHRDADMTHFEYWVVAMLSEAPNRRLQLKHLAEQSNSSPSRLSHVLRRLEERGWVVREPHPNDSRASDAVLTDAGWRKVVATAPGHVEHVQRLIFDALTDDDVDDLARICERLVARLEHH